MEAVAEVDQGSGNGRFMWRPACEGSDRGRSRRQRQRQRQIEVMADRGGRDSGRLTWRRQRQIEAAQRQICIEAAVWRQHRG